MNTIEEVNKGLNLTTEQERYNSLFQVLKGSEEYTLDRFGNILSSNLEAVNVTGFEEWEVIGKSIDIFYTDEDKAIKRYEDDLKKASVHGFVSMKAWRLRKRKTAFWAKVKIAAFTSDNLSGYKMTIKDATHNFIYKYRSRRIKNEYLNLVNNRYIGIFKFNIQDYRITLLNERAQEVMNVNFEKKEFFKSVFADPEQFHFFISTLKTGGHVENFELKLAKQTERWATISCSLFDEEGVVGGVIQDITDQKRQIIELQRLNHELDRFIYHASHDLRAPLTSIMGLLNLMEIESEADMKNKYTPMIRDRVQHLDKLLKDLVQITFNNKNELDIVVFDFEDEILEILKEFTTQYHNIEVYFEQDNTNTFYSDAVRLRAIIRNLLSNALKYHNPHVANPHVKVTVSGGAEKFILTFKDNGIGIPPENLQHIYEIFYRCNANVSGTGLGLYIVKSMIDRMGGGIDVSSEYGTGSVFTVTLPNFTLKQ